MDILQKVNDLRIPYFRGVFCVDQLPKTPKPNEIAIVNLDLSTNRGSHWVSFVKKKNQVFYYDSFGNLRPPEELRKYLRRCKIFYNYERDQSFGSFNCGHLCLNFVLKKSIELFG